MMKRFEEDNFSRKVGTLGKAIGIPLVFLLGLGFARGIGNNFAEQDRKIQEAFLGNCGTQEVEVLGEPYIFAKQQLERLRSEYPTRFENVPSEEGREELVRNFYHKETNTFTIPNYNCSK